jgi:hypothetical protein
MVILNVIFFWAYLGIFATTLASAEFALVIGIVIGSRCCSLNLVGGRLVVSKIIE